MNGQHLFQKAPAMPYQEESHAAEKTRGKASQKTVKNHQSFPRMQIS